MDTRNLYKIIGKNINKQRKESKRKLTQKDLAQECGINRTSLILIEQGEQNVPIDKIYRIANVLGISIDILLPDLRELHDKDESISVHIDSTAKLDTSDKENVIEAINNPDPSKKRGS